MGNLICFFFLYFSFLISLIRLQKQKKNSTNEIINGLISNLVSKIFVRLFKYTLPYTEEEEKETSVI